MNPGTGVLTKTQLIEHMRREPLSRRLVITPLLNPEESIGTSSIDVRLGNQFIIFKRESFPVLDVVRGLNVDGRSIGSYQERIVRRYGKEIVLHPRELVIGSTLEYVQVPTGLMCYVVGRSTWGRMGLMIATATKVDPGFRGCITLEIVNEGEIPLVLYPGLMIAQLVFHETSGQDVYEGPYDCPIGPQFPRFDLTEWRKTWVPQNAPNRDQPFGS